MTRETFWVIEIQGPSYLRVSQYGGHVFEWSDDICTAIEFCNESSADLSMTAIRELRPDLFPVCLPRPAKAVEHAWLEATR